MKQTLSLATLGFLLLAPITFGQQSEISSLTNVQTLPPSSPGTQSLPEVVVLGHQIDQAMDRVVPSLGANKYTINEQQITDQSEGENAPLSQTLLRAPGMAQDQYG